MNIWNKYFKIVIYKETADVHSGVRYQQSIKGKNDESVEHLALELSPHRDRAQHTVNH